MKHFWAMALLGLVVFFSGCGKKQEVELVPLPGSEAVSVELPVLEQNKVASNPVMGEKQEPVLPFEPAPGDPGESEDGGLGD